MRLHRLFLPLFLALGLLLGQQAAQLHELSHAIGSIQQGPQHQHPGSDSCDKCSLFAAFWGAAASFVMPVIVLGGAIVAALASYLPALSRTVVHSRSRAPPASA